MHHGGDLTEARALWGAGEPAWLDLSTGINPHRWPVPDGLATAGIDRLPSAADLARLLSSAREAYRVPDPVALVAAPGTQTLIQWLPRLAPPGEVAVVGPTYAEHADSWRAAGRDVRMVSDLGEAGTARHRIVVRPNNPDGRLATLESLRAAARPDGWLVVDESFIDLDPKASAVPLCAEAPVVVLRSFGKFYGLPGLRLGFAAAPQAIADRIAEALGPWAVAGPALAIGAAALADRDWADAMRERLVTEARLLDDVLEAGGLPIVGGTNLYRLVRTPEAGLLHDALAREHIWCRSFVWDTELLRFGLPGSEAGLMRLDGALSRFRHAQGTRTVSPRKSAR